MYSFRPGSGEHVPCRMGLSPVRGPCGLPTDSYADAVGLRGPGWRRCSLGQAIGGTPFPSPRVGDRGTGHVFRRTAESIWFPQRSSLLPLLQRASGIPGWPAVLVEVAFAGVGFDPGVDRRRRASRRKYTDYREIVRHAPIVDDALAPVVQLRQQPGLHAGVLRVIRDVVDLVRIDAQIVQLGRRLTGREEGCLLGREFPLQIQGPRDGSNPPVRPMASRAHMHRPLRRGCLPSTPISARHW